MPLEVASNRNVLLMAITTFTYQQIGPNLWRFDWLSDEETPTYYVYLDGRLAQTTTKTWMQITIDAGEYVQVDVFDDAETVPDPAYPARAYVTWDGDTDAAYYRIDEYTTIDGTLTTRTDADTGVITVAEDHGIEADDTTTIYWTDGRRDDMTVTDAGDTTITVDGGSGDDLPAATSALRVGTGWTQIGKVRESGQSNYRWLTAALDDDTEHTLRVIPLGANDLEGLPREITVFMIRRPDVPSVSYTYSAVTGKITIAEA